ncbi:MAG TPA: TonB-dependent receptor, partial [Saprospiraceae bacterium]|nr:TonB-dependent receptor [Saprospiraceae bacterium]
PAATLLLNQTTLGETNAHAYLSRRFGGAQGFTLLAAATRRPARDLNHDGFAEIAQTAPLMLHPRWFFGLGKKTGGDLGVNFSQNHLRGGDQAAIRENQASAEHPFYQRERIQRFTAHGQIHTLLSPTATWTLRGAGSAFGRSGMYAGLDFAGRQLNTYLETNVLWHVRQTDAVLGGSLTTEHFDLRHSAPTVAFGDFGQQTAGVFAQLDRRFSQKVALQLGLRTDHSSRYGWFVLPRASLLYRPGAQLSARLGYGRGYKAPDLFAATEPSDFTRLLPLSASIRPDLAHSLNLDLNYRLLLFEALSLQFNQAFYYVHLTAPFVLQRDAAGAIFLENAHATGQVLGTDSYLQLRYAAWELYLGYNHTQSERRATDRSKSPEPFNPQDKVAATLAWSLAPHWRFGLEAAWTGRQYGNGGEGYPTFWFFAGMVARQFNWGRVVLNCENLGDARQARHAPLVTGSRLAPAFAPLWGPVEGRVVNLSVKLDL